LKKTPYASLELFYAMLALILVLIFSAPPTARAQTKSTKSTKSTKAVSPPVDTFLTGPPFTVETLEKTIPSVRRGIMTEERLIDGLKHRGVDFPPMPETFSRLSNAGCSELVLETVRELATAKFPPPPPPPPPAPEPEKPKLKMLFKCEPAECQVRIGDKPYSTTKNGEFLFDGLDPGRIIVDSRKEGFNPRTEVVEVQDSGSGATIRHAVVLQPTEESQHQWGQQIIQGMLTAIRLQTGPRTITGTLKISKPSLTAFDVVATFEEAGSATFELRSSAGGAQIACKADRCSLVSNKNILSHLGLGGKQLKPDEIQPMLSDLEVFLAYEFEEFLAGLADATTSSTAAVNPSSSAEPKTFRVARTSGSYTVQLGDAMRPSNIAYDSSTGVGSGIHVTYSDYKKIGDADYPATTELKFGGAAHSILFQAQNLTHGAVRPSSVPAK
jgi:hypothetical protein